MNPDDPTFQKAKRIKSGKAQPDFEFALLSEWTKAEFNATLINADVYFYKQMSNPTQLRLIFADAEDFDRIPVFWKDRLATFGEKFKAILTENKIQKYDHFDFTKMDVDYSWLNELCFRECIYNLDTAAIKKEFNACHIWLIQPFGSQIQVFYQTNDDIRKFEASGVSDQIKSRVKSLCLANDEFNVLQDRTLEFLFDSKENFDKAGSWYNYYK